MEPLVSIVMPYYNVEPYFDKAIRSLLNQSYKNLEILCADDCSTDDSKKVLEKYDDKRILHFDNEEKLGYTKTCNKLLYQCKGDYIGFQDADDYSDTSRLEKQVELLKYNNVGICGTGAYIIDSKDGILDTTLKYKTSKEIKAGLVHSNQFLGATILISRKVFEEIGGYRTEFSRWSNQDYDWSYRIMESFEGINIQEPLYYYRQQEWSNSKKISIDRALGANIVAELGRQRAHHGSDYLLDKDVNGMNLLVEKLKKPYLSDPSRIYREHAQKRIYFRAYKSAWALSIQAIKLNWTKTINYTLILMILRRMILSSLRSRLNK